MRPEAGRGAEAQSVTVKSTSIPDSEVKYLFIFIFSFFRSGVEAERGVEFHHSARNASRNRQNVGNGVS